MSVVRQLIEQGVAQCDIALLSQYRAQYKELQSRLAQICYPAVTVSTVAAAQGSSVYLQRLLGCRQHGTSYSAWLSLGGR